MHLSCVRGSPLLRTILVLGVLCISALGFVKLTREGGKAVGLEVVSGLGKEGKNEEGGERMIPAKVRLTLSCMAGYVEVSAGEERMRGALDDNGSFLGELNIDPENPVVFVKVSCIPQVGRNFAKLVVDAEGQETFTHVFDAEGDIDDFVELPF